MVVMEDRHHTDGREHVPVLYQVSADLSRTMSRDCSPWGKTSNSGEDVPTDDQQPIRNRFRLICGVRSFAQGQGSIGPESA